MSTSLKRQINHWIAVLQKHTHSWWYAPVLGVLAAIDHFVIVIPTDGLLVSAVMLNPRRWFYTFVCVTVGSSIGAWLLAVAVASHGLPFLLQILPALDETAMWSWTEQFMHQYGLYAVFAVAAAPIMQHPAIALAAMAAISPFKIFAVVILGRFIKYCIMAFVASHTPHLVRRLWGVSGEVQEVEELQREDALAETAGAAKDVA